jgi:hypothetical protein
MLEGLKGGNKTPSKDLSTDPDLGAETVEDDVARDLYLG